MFHAVESRYGIDFVYDNYNPPQIHSFITKKLRDEWVEDAPYVREPMSYERKNYYLPRATDAYIHGPHNVVEAYFVLPDQRAAYEAYLRRPINERVNTRENNQSGDSIS